MVGTIFRVAFSRMEMREWARTGPKRKSMNEFVEYVIVHGPFALLHARMCCGLPY